MSWSPWPPTSDVDAWRALVAERAAIQEHDGGLTREQADRAAAEFYRLRFAEQRRRGQ